MLAGGACARHRGETAGGQKGVTPGNARRATETQGETPMIRFPRLAARAAAVDLPEPHGIALPGTPEPAR